MYQPDSASSSCSLALPSIRLKLQDHILLVVPEAELALQPFRLPLIRKSLLDFLAMAGRTFQQQHQRCLAVLLVLDLSTRQWGWGIPAQRASRDAACWDVRKDDFPATSPSIRIAGSFQLRILAAGEEPRDAVPPVDGVHLVLSLQEEQPMLWSFVRVDQQILDPATQILFMDDLAIFIRECEERIQLV